ncbi:MAG: hypothetical protein JSS31_07880 [Proteobacteria bacterium]|nr:hypothetical protein [Pseudomonadota bacterium]MBS0493869.1 hypothetical protein [Pseudomonadota bacterium]
MNSIFQRRAGALAASALGLTLALAAAPALAQQSPATTQADLARKLEQLAAELAEVKAQLAQMQAAQPQAAAGQGGWNGTATGAAGANAPAAVAAAAPAPVAAEPATVLTSYGEINYNRPTKAGDKTQLDLRRFVLGLQHRINERTKIVGELEVEHAVTSASDPGEVALEQAYVEHQLTPLLAARGGLFLMPVGLLNETHEPTAYYGVERNFVETAIIPTTWREAGGQLIANFDNGLTLQGGISTSFDLTKWNASSGDGTESPLGSIHQEAAKAKARNLALFGAANWRGVPGLLVGGSVFSGNATHRQPGFASARITLADLHARWTPGRWDLAALYALGRISNTAALNEALVGNPTLIPKSFGGGYVQAAYKLWQQGDYTLSPFARLERFNTARAFANLGPGLTPDAARTEQVATVGANFWVTRSVVLKADYQRFRVNTQANRVNLGLGWSF